MINCRGHIIRDPQEVLRKNLTNEILEGAKVDVDYFLVPNYMLTREIKTFSMHQRCLMYKIGFLVEYLKVLHPEWSMENVYGLIFWKYQVFLSRRNMRQYYTHWKKNRKSLMYPVKYVSH